MDLRGWEQQNEIDRQKKGVIPHTITLTYDFTKYKVVETDDLDNLIVLCKNRDFAYQMTKKYIVEEN